jgi:hypothetical protein
MMRRRIGRASLVAALLVARAGAAPCPDAGVVTIVGDTRTAAGAVALDVSGERLDSPGACDADPGLDTSYATTVVCTGPGVVRCGAPISNLAPGLWVHRVSLQVAGSSPQIQARQGLVLGGMASNTVDWTIFGKTIVVDGGTSLPAAIDAAATFTAGSALPALVRFDRAMFPGASSPTSIALQPPSCTPLDTCAPDGRKTAYCFEGSRITVDALDDDGRPGGVVVGIGSCNNSVMRIYGNDDVVRGLVLNGGTQGPIEVDTVVIAGPSARRNRLEQCRIQGPAAGDGVSVEDQAGASQNATAANVIADSEVFGAQDKGIKVVGGGIVRVERSCVHDNNRGGIQVTNGGTAIAVENVVQHNRGESPEHGLLVGVPSDTAQNALTTRGNVVRFNGVRGISVVNKAQATLRDDLVANNYMAGIRVESTLPGIAPSVNARGVAFVCNYAPGVCENEVGHICRANEECAGMSCKPGSGAAAANGLGIGLQVVDTGTVPPDVDLGTGGTDPGRNAITLNANGAANPVGVNFKSNLVLSAPLMAVGNQWQHCDVPFPDPVNQNRCNVTQVAQLDIQLDPGATAPNLGTPIGPRHGPDPVVSEISPARPRAGELVRAYGGTFNAIDGAACHPQGLPDDPCSAENPSVVTINASSPSQGNSVTIAIDGRSFNAPVHQVTPTMLVFEMPVDCYGPATLTVARGNDVGRSVPFCDPDGCAGRPTGSPCDDQSVCTQNETCQPNGTCRGAFIDCSGQCFTGMCDPQDGCVIKPADAACEDGNLCTAGDHCSGQGNVCIPGGPAVCDGDCLTGVCIPATGCVPRPSTVACDDASVCTVDDHCSGVDGMCVGTNVSCDDGSPCTVDACDAVTGCAHARLPEGAACPPTDACHAEGACRLGGCVAGDALDCDDNDACTDDACDPATGCQLVARVGIAGVTCHATQLASMVDAIPPDGKAFAKKLRPKVVCIQKRLSAAAKKPQGSAAQKRLAKKARNCAERLVDRVQRSRLSATERARFGDEGSETVTAVETFFGI